MTTRWIGSKGPCGILERIWKMLLDNNERANRVVFNCDLNPRVMEPGSKPGRWNLTQEAKSWLVKEGIKVFVQMGDSDRGQIATIRFKTPEHAREFFMHWRDAGHG